MALNKAGLEAALKNALDAQSDKEVDPKEARANMAKDMDNAIDIYIKTATVSVVAGIPVTTAGTAAAQTGATTGTGTGTGTIS